MELTKSERGFYYLHHQAYLEPHAMSRLVSESSAVGDYEDSLDKPGSSFLRVGDKHHLNREEVAEFVTHLQRWLQTGRLAPVGRTPQQVRQPSWQQRAVDEKAELDGKIRKLEEFLQGEEISEVPQEQLALLLQQLVLMEDYSAVLQFRIGLFAKMCPPQSELTK